MSPTLVPVSPRRPRPRPRPRHLTSTTPDAKPSTKVCIFQHVVYSSTGPAVLVTCISMDTCSLELHRLSANKFYTFAYYFFLHSALRHGDIVRAVSATLYFVALQEDVYLSNWENALIIPIFLTVTSISPPSWIRLPLGFGTVIGNTLSRTLIKPIGHTRATFDLGIALQSRPLVSERSETVRESSCPISHRRLPRYRS